jgi:hypothetical protein
MRNDIIHKLAEWDTDKASERDLREMWWNNAYNSYSDMSDEELLRARDEMESNEEEKQNDERLIEDEFMR